MTDITKLRQQLAEATPGDWREGQYEENGFWYGRIFFPGDPRNPLTNTRDCPLEQRDASLIVSMKNSLPALLDELERLREIEHQYYKVGSHEIWEKLNSPSMKDIAGSVIEDRKTMIERLSKE